MKICELRARENFDVMLEQTIRDGMALYPENVDSNEKISWFVHPIFSVYVTRDFCSSGRRYLKNQYRNTPKKCRRLLQFSAVELLSSRPFFDRMLKSAFETPKCKNASSLMWMPGNHRFRLFDFEQKNVCVFPKSGFSDEGIQREIEFRTKYAEKFNWIVPLLKFDAEQAVFVEPLLDAYPFDREPSDCKRNIALADIAHMLSELHTIKFSKMRASAYLSIKHEQLHSALDRVKTRFPGFSSKCVEQIWQKAVSIISTLNEVELSLTHGDFQPGNILLSADDEKKLWLIDWEDVAVRAKSYDVMTWTLKSRFPKGLSNRISQFSGFENSPFGENSLPSDQLLALWGIEDLIWHLEATSRPGIQRLSSSICQLIRELKSTPLFV